MSYRTFVVLGLLVINSVFALAQAQVSKGNWILLQHGLQVQGMVTKDDVFHLNTYSNANYTAISWLWDANPPLHGTQPGFPWSRWVRNQTEMPPLDNEVPYISQLIAVQLGDEADLNNGVVRTNMINWFVTVRSNWPNTILYANNFGGQVGDAPLADFYTQARPDMLCFDSYPWKSVYAGAGNPPGAALAGPPTSWYGDLRRYREHAKGAGLPFATYRQTFHAIQDYDATVYRNPSPSELRLNTFAALAFNAKTLIDFTYNTGASALFTSPGGDSYPNPLYSEIADANLRARNLSKALLRLKPVEDLHNPNTPNPPPGPSSDDVNFPTGYTTSIMFLRGKSVTGGVTNFTTVPNSFLNDPSSSANPNLPNSLAYTWWEFSKNDPYLSGFAFTNKAASRNNGLHGDVIVAWFKPLEESMDGPIYSNQVYMMVVNGFTDPSGTAADCLQEVRLDFSNLANAMTNLIMLDPATGQLQTNGLPSLPPPNASKRRLTLNLNGGDAALFKFNTGAPFVGVTPLAPVLSARITTGAVAISFPTAIGSRYQLEFTTAVPSTNWTILTNVLAPTATFQFVHESQPGVRSQFYRAVALP